MSRKMMKFDDTQNISVRGKGWGVGGLHLDNFENNRPTLFKFYRKSPG